MKKGYVKKAWFAVMVVLIVVLLSFSTVMGASMPLGPAIGANTNISSTTAGTINVKLTQIDASLFPQIRCYVSVTDSNNNVISNLTAANFQVTEQSNLESQPTVENPIDVSTVSNYSGISIALVMDCSGSMAGEKMNDAKQSAVNFLNLLHYSSGDRAAVIAFSDSPWIAQNFTYDKNALVSAVNGLSVGGWTALNDAIYMAITETSKENNVKAVIALTDGRENSSTHTKDDVINYANSKNIPVYTIGLGSDVDQQYLEDIANGTHGKYFFTPDASKLSQIYSEIASRESQQYLVTYSTHNPNYDGTTRTVTIQVTSSEGSGQDQGVYHVIAPPSITLSSSTSALLTQSQPNGAPIVISAQITSSNSSIQSAFLFYRRSSPGGSNIYKQVSMTHVSGNEYSYTIPGNEVQSPGIDFYISAYDGQLTATLPKNSPALNPFQIPVLPNHAPVINHTPVSSWTTCKPLEISAMIEDNDQGDYVSSAALFYRVKGHLLYKSMNMVKGSNNIYSATIPSNDVTTQGIEYYIMAADSHGIRSYSASSDIPYEITISACAGSNWAEAVGGTNDDEGYGVCATSDGGCILTGATKSFGSGGANVVVTKLDASGKIQWSKVFGGTGNEEPWYRIFQMPDGSYILSGWTASVGAGNQDIFIMKLSSSGSLQWAKTYGGSDSDAVWDVEPTSDGGYIVGAETYSFGVGDEDLLIMKLSSSGSLQWAKTYGGSDTEAGAFIKQTLDGGYILSGRTNSFGSGKYDALIMKLSSSGSLQWAKTYGGSDDDGGAEVLCLGNGNYIFTGWTHLRGNLDGFVAEIDQTGSLQWTKLYGGSGKDELLDLCKTNNGFIDVGSTKSFGSGGYDAFLISIDSYGNLKKALVLGGSGDDYYSTASVKGNEVFAVGTTASFGTGGEDILITKVDADPQSLTGCSYLKTVSPGVVNATFNTGNWSPTQTNPSLIVHSASFNWSSPSLSSTLICTFGGAPDFTISASPSSQSVTQGSSATYTVTLTAQNGFNSQVSLSASDPSSGTSFSFSPNPLTPSSSGSTSTLTVSTTSSAQTGTHTITINATGGGKTHTTTVTLDVTFHPSRTLSIPDTQSTPGTTVTIPISVNDADGIAGGDFTITFNSNILTATNVQCTSLTNGFSLTKNLNNPGEVRISLASASGISDPNYTGGALVNITFTVSASAPVGSTTALTFTKADIKDENGNNIPSTTQNGTFTVGGMLGDVNGDGSIDSGDAILVLRYSAGLINLNSSQLACADVNKDGTVDSGDAILVLRYAAGLIDHF